MKTPLAGLESKFDLALSLEVIQHIPERGVKMSIDFLTRLAPVVLFSAPIPFQGGAVTPVNEQWPDYWEKLFANHGYVVVDCIREKIWNNDRVMYWYAQNILIFVREDYLETNNMLKEKYTRNHQTPLSLVYPKIYLSRTRKLQKRLSFKGALKALPRAFINTIKHIK